MSLVDEPYKSVLLELKYPPVPPPEVAQPNSGGSPRNPETIVQPGLAPPPVAEQLEDVPRQSETMAPHRPGEEVEERLLDHEVLERPLDHLSRHARRRPLELDHLGVGVERHRPALLYAQQHISRVLMYLLVRNRYLGKARMGSDAR